MVQFTQHTLAAACRAYCSVESLARERAASEPAHPLLTVDRICEPGRGGPRQAFLDGIGYRLGLALKQSPARSKPMWSVVGSRDAALELQHTHTPHTHRARDDEIGRHRYDYCDGAAQE